MTTLSVSGSALGRNNGPVAGAWAMPLALHGLLFMAIAIGLQAATFGDLSRHADESFYFLVGQRMHEGVLPYVDVWDRKPLGLFIIYYLIAGVSTSVLAYQIAACVLAGVTALLVSRIVNLWCDTRASILAGVAYLFSILAFEGISGQTPDLYNPLIAGAALIVATDLGRLLRGELRLRIYGAMALCGLALTMKQTAVFESALFGLTVLVCLHRGGMSPGRIASVAAKCCILGVLPTLLIAAWYWQIGHWMEFWHAMVLSNIAKTNEGQEWFRAISIVVKGLPIVVLCTLGVLNRRIDPMGRNFMMVWLTVALIGFVSVPNYYGHYLLPVLVPMSVAAGFAFQRVTYWLVAILVVIAYSFLWHYPFDRARTVTGNGEFLELAELLKNQDGGGGLLVYDGPTYLYAVTGKRFLSPLVFPSHLNHRIERNVSHLNTDREVDRVLASRPGVIMISRYPRSSPPNFYTRRSVFEYARANCRTLSHRTLSAENLTNDLFLVFGQCGHGGFGTR